MTVWHAGPAYQTVSADYSYVPEINSLIPVIMNNFEILMIGSVSAETRRSKDMTE